MTPKNRTRQQQRARQRSPLKTKRRGSTAFTSVLLALLVAGGVGIYLSRANPPPLTRGASIGEHWHASYRIYICGQRVANYPSVEGEIHSHGDGFMHIHPSTAAASGDLASLSTFLRVFETNISVNDKNRRELVFPDGKKYTDGDRCADGKKYNWELLNKGKTIKEKDWSAFLPHDGDAIVMRFGKEGKKLMDNPYNVSKGLPQTETGDEKTPAPDGAAPPVELPVPTPGASGSPAASEEPPEATAED